MHGVRLCGVTSIPLYSVHQYNVNCISNPLIVCTTSVVVGWGADYARLFAYSTVHCSELLDILHVLVRWDLLGSMFA